MNSKEKRNMVSLIVGFVGAFLLIAGALAQYYEKKEADKEASDQKKEADKWNKKFIKSQKDLDKKTIENHKLSLELKAKADSIIYANIKVMEELSESAKRMTGHGTVEPLFIYVSPGVYNLYIKPSDKYSIYDVNITVINFDNYLKCPKMEIDGQNYVEINCAKSQYSYYYDSALVPDSYGSATNHFFQFSEGANHFKLQFSSRNCLTMRDYMFSVMKGKIVQKVYREFIFDNGNFNQLSESYVRMDNKYWEAHFGKYKPDLLVPFKNGVPDIYK